MIKPEELRVGNWIEAENKQYKITSGVMIGQLQIGIDIWTMSVKPIPVTTEILEKCGFKEESKCWWEKDNFQLLFSYTVDYGDFFHYTSDRLILSTAYKYLHQLQNLYFALIGEELNYEP